MACEGSELVGLSPNTTTINHTSNGATTGWSLWSTLRHGNGLNRIGGAFSRSIYWSSFCRGRPQRQLPNVPPRLLTRSQSWSWSWPWSWSWSPPALPWSPWSPLRATPKQPGLRPRALLAHLYLLNTGSTAAKLPPPRYPGGRPPPPSSWRRCRPPGERHLLGNDWSQRSLRSRLVHQQPLVQTDVNLFSFEIITNILPTSPQLSQSF